LKTEGFSWVYQQNPTFINKKAFFFATSLDRLGYSDIFALIINYKQKKTKL